MKLSKIPSIEETLVNVLEWANEKGILSEESKYAQYLKIMEEFGELKDGIRDQVPNMIIDGLGDVLVTLVICAKQNGLNETKIIEVLNNPLHSFFDCIEDFNTNMCKLASCLLRSERLEAQNKICNLFISLKEIAAKEKQNLSLCFYFAYEEIKDRKGKLENGTFIKE